MLLGTDICRRFTSTQCLQFYFDSKMECLYMLASL